MSESACHLIVVDDDFLIRKSWEIVAKNRGLALKAFTGPEDLLAQISQIPLQTPIYIDSNLGQGKKGEDLALQLHQMGYRELYLCTGYPPEQFAHVTWVKGVLGKDFPSLGG